MVARLRAECHRLGIRDVSITGAQARLAPLRLRTSEEMRLRRLARGSRYKEDLRQVVVPLPRGPILQRSSSGSCKKLVTAEPVTSPA